MKRIPNLTIPAIVAGGVAGVVASQHRYALACIFGAAALLVAVGAMRQAGRYTDGEQAALMLRDHLADLDPDGSRPSPGMGCCGCGAWLCDVVTVASKGYAAGEGYCWTCVDRSRPTTGYTVLAGRERNAHEVPA